MITLLSDFGRKDVYVAVMKGVIATIAPETFTCDLTHEVPPQDILAGRFNLMLAYPYFPIKTVHLAVVDPGVGSSRRAMAVECSRGFLVGPDNGLLSGVLQQETVLQAITLNNPAYWHTEQPSQTFHGRDIFAPAAAHLARGVAILELGDRIDPATLIQPALPPFTELAKPSQILSDSARFNSEPFCLGSIQYIDGFGNLISNIPHSALPDLPWQVTLKTQIQTQCFPGIKFYADVPIGAIAALVGSHGFIEIACNRGNAAAALRISNQELSQITTFSSVEVSLATAMA